jgi:hypothetical protein
MLVYGHPDQTPMTVAEGQRCSIDLLNRAAMRGLALLIERDRNSATDLISHERETTR